MSAKEGGRADDELFLVADGEVQRRGDRRRGLLEKPAALPRRRGAPRRARRAPSRRSPRGRTAPPPPRPKRLCGREPCSSRARARARPRPRLGPAASWIRCCRQRSAAHRRTKPGARTEPAPRTKLVRQTKPGPRRKPEPQRQPRPRRKPSLGQAARASRSQALLQQSRERHRARDRVEGSRCLTWLSPRPQHSPAALSARSERSLESCTHPDQRLTGTADASHGLIRTCSATAAGFSSGRR